MSYRRHKMMQDGGIDLSKDWFKINVFGEGVCTINCAYTITSIGFICYSLNGKKWKKHDKQWSSNIPLNISIPVVEGDVIYFKAYVHGYERNNSESSRINCTAPHTLSGNIMSLLYADDFEDKVAFYPNTTRQFKGLFLNDTALTSCEDLKLPATTLCHYCYCEMFKGCSSLKVPPRSLPASNLPGNCYSSMFSNTIITTHPTMPVITSIEASSMANMFQNTKIADASTIIINVADDSSCKGIFYGCKQLVNGPQLLADTPVSNCYYTAFYGCSSIMYIKCLLKTNSNNAMIEWSRGAKNTNACVFVKHIDATWTNTGASGVPSNWKIIYYDPTLDKYYLDQNRTTECDDHGNVIN